jgi:parallel beta-helix repeat protein
MALQKRIRRSIAIPTFVFTLMSQIFFLAPLSFAASFTVANTADSGAGSLRQAIIDANASPGADQIDFSVGGTITLLSDLPEITDSLIIDGSSAPALLSVDASGMNYGFRFGGGSANEVNGLSITGGTIAGIYANGGSTGLIIGGADPNLVVSIDGAADGIFLDNTSNVTITAARVGLSSGSSNNGLRVNNSSNVLVVGQGTERNVFSNSTNHGVYITGNSSNIALMRNNIGTDFSGLVAQGNGGSGVYVDGTVSNLTIGGDSGLNEGNLISGNAANGIQLEVGNVRVHGNTIGLNNTQSATLPNGTNGVLINSDNNEIGQIGVSSTSNIISGNGNSGIYLNSGNTNTIANNFIGTNATSDAGLGNTQSGIEFTPGGAITGTVIGSSGSGNLISGNGASGIMSPGNANTGTQIIGNIIGLESDQSTPLANGFAGIEISSDSCTINSNMISGNLDHGIWLNGADSCTIQYNLIGLAGDGSTQVPNAIHGITIEAGASSNIIGGDPNLNLSNAIFSANTGISIEGSAGDFNTVEENRFVGVPGFPLIQRTNPSNESIANPSITGASTNTSEAHGTAEPDAIVDLYVDGNFVGNTIADGLGNWSFYGALSGTQLDAYQTNLNGSSSSSVSENPLTIDITAPVNAAVMTSPNTLTNTALQAITGTKDAYTGVELNGIEIVAPDALTTWSSSTTLAEGDNTLSFRATDYSGNISLSSNEYAWELDSIAPVLIEVNYDENTSRNAEEISGIVSEANAEIWIDGVQVTSADGGGNFSTSIALNNGSNNFSLMAYDGINFSSASLVSIKRSGGITMGGGSSSGYSSNDDDEEPTIEEEEDPLTDEIESPTDEDNSEDQDTEEPISTDSEAPSSPDEEDPDEEPISSEENPVEDLPQDDESPSTPQEPLEEPYSPEPPTQTVEQNPETSFVGPETIVVIQNPTPIDVIPETFEVEAQALFNPNPSIQNNALLNELTIQTKFNGEAPSSDADSDQDGISDAEELQFGSDPEHADSDGDGIDDRTEIYELGSSPSTWDTDGDGLEDTIDLNPNQYDKAEVSQETQMEYEALFQSLLEEDSKLSQEEAKSIGQRDSDGDGMSDQLELEAGTDPFSQDSDGDGLSDTDELYLYGSNPKKDSPASTLNFGVSNYQSGNTVSAGAQLLTGSSGTNEADLTVKIYMLDETGESILVGESQTDTEGRFSLTTDEIPSGEHNFYSVLEGEETLDVSEPFTLTVAEEELLKSPTLSNEGLQAGDQTTETQPKIQLDLSEVPVGSTVTVVWRSLVLHQTLIADGGTIEIEAPAELESGTHTVSWNAKSYDDETGALLASSADSFQFEVQAVQTAFIDADTGGSSKGFIVLGAILTLVTLSGLAFFFKPRHPKGD